MSGETRQQVSGWTVDTLLQLMDERDRRYEQRFMAQQEALNVAHSAAREAKTLAERNEVHYREQANEWRDTMDDRERTLARKDDLKPLETGIGELKDRTNRSEGSGRGKHELFQILLGVVGAVAGFVVAWLMRAP